MKTALVVLSGGQDSTTCLAMAIMALGVKNVHAVTFDYGQTHARELQAAREIAILAGIAERHEVIKLGPILKGTSPLVNKAEKLEQYASYAEMDGIIGKRIEKTFVPMRNALFLTIAANRASCLGLDAIVTGVCEADNANYPDCRANFINSQETTINEALGTIGEDRLMDENGIRIWTPIIQQTKAQTIQHMMNMGGYPLLAFTHTAYDGQYPPIGHDHATVLRAQGFVEAGVPDPLVVRAMLDGLMQIPSTSNYDALRIGAPLPLPPFIKNMIEMINVSKEELQTHAGVRKAWESAPVMADHDGQVGAV